MAQLPTTRSRTRTADIKREEKSDRPPRQFTVDDAGSEDGAWEDEEILKKLGEDGRSSRQDSPSGSMRMRKRRRTPHTTNGPRKLASLPPPARPLRDNVENHPTRDDALEVFANMAIGSLKFTVRYSMDVFSTAIHLLRRPLSLLVFLWLFAFIISRISHTLRGAFSPLCILPGISSSRLCRSWDDLSSQGKQNPRWADYPKLVDVQSKSFGQLLDESVGGSGLSLEIKKAEMATTDLVTLVRVSDLKGRDTLATSLVEFVEDAKKTGRGLQRLSSKIGGAVDSTMAMNDYALGTIEAAQKAKPSRLHALNPWRSPTRSINEVVTETFGEAMDVLSINMERLILEAEVNLKNLDALEERLLILHEIVSREDSSLSNAKSDLLAELWTKLGGNRKSLRKFEQHLGLLKDLGSYRQQALVHVVAALQTLHVMSADMEELRERVATPGIVGSKIPIEVHMKSIKLGLQRLKEGRIKAREMEEAAVRRVLSINGSDED